MKDPGDPARTNVRPAAPSRTLTPTLSRKRRKRERENRKSHGTAFFSSLLGPEVTLKCLLPQEVETPLFEKVTRAPPNENDFRKPQPSAASLRPGFAPQ